ncbi:MAG: glycoside hydrolase family 38 C-terminal domain-containing protein [Phycisphaerae bacterium]|jgi:alpha-mannosidase
MSYKTIIHVISGTHWDREWRYTADQSLLRLAELMDELLDVLEKDDNYLCFHLDGGTIVIEDYLAVRPQNAERLRRLIRQGRLSTVKWYTLPEMSTVAPESLIRNLLIGKRLADTFGGSMNTGYTATSYGQISQLPQIYSGFGIDTALTYRGTNKHQVPPICLWEGSDGTRICNIRCFDEATRTNWFFFIHYELVLNKTPRDLQTEWKPAEWPVHMSDEKLYETAFQLKNESLDFKKNGEDIQKALAHFVKQASQQAIGNNLLALDMEDNACAYSNLPYLIETINKAQDKYLVQQSSLDDYVKTIKKAVNLQQLPVLKGEMRYTAVEVCFNGLYGMTHSSRIPLKLMNDEAERELINVAEPLSSFSSIMGGSYEHSLLRRAWLELLKNHAHDSICGAAIEDAHKDNPARFRAVCSISRECSRKACEEIWCKLDTQSWFQDGDITITFFNTLPTRRVGVHKVIIDTPNITCGDMIIEPCSGAGPIRDGVDPDQMVTYQQFDLIDEAGQKVPSETLEKEIIEVEVERKLDSNAAAYKNILRNRILMDVDIPPFGYRTYALRPCKRRYVLNPQPGPDRSLIARMDGILENEFIKVVINLNGTFNIIDKQTGKNIEGMHYFCDSGSIGIAHLDRAPLRDYTVTSLCNAAVLTLCENNTLRATWRIDMTINIPAEADLDGRNRSTKMVPLSISTFLTLRKGAKRLEIKTHIDNVARDHRLRVMFPTDIKTDYVYADGPFDVIKRGIQWNITGDNAEGHYPTQPMKKFVSLSDGKNGVAFLSKGLNEYEVIDDARRTLAVTLLRTHRAYMLANRGLKTPEEYEHQAGQHCLGSIDFEYAIYIHGGNWVDGRVIAEAEDFRIPQRVIQGIPKNGVLPATNSLLSISPSEHIQLSAFYKVEGTNSYIMRVWNSHTEPVLGSIETSFEVKSITKVSMDEERKEKQLVREDNVWSLPLRKSEIATLLVEM